MRKLIFLGIVLFFILSAAPGYCQDSEDEDRLKKRVDSLFVLSCGGLEKYRDLQQPAESTLVEMGEMAVPHLLEKLTTQSAREKWTLIRVFGKIGEPAVMPVIGRLESEEKNETKLAIRILGEIKDNRAVGPLTGLLDREDYNIRSHVCESLGKIADTTAFDHVSPRMQDSVEVVRKSVAVALGRMKIARAVPYLVHGLSDSHFSVRMSSANSLVEIGDSSVEALLFLLDHSAPPTLHLAIESLGKLKDKRAVPPLLDKLKDDDWATRAFAVDALSEIDD
ncbi:MAG: HEAT repeat domain-containing protein, partial [Candidatus Zixiibacteriota bacterium]